MTTHRQHRQTQGLTTAAGEAMRGRVNGTVCPKQIDPRTGVSR